MNKLTELSKWLQVVTVSVLTLRLIIIFILMQKADNDLDTLKKRAKNTILWLIVSQMAFVIFNIIKSYF